MKDSRGPVFFVQERIGRNRRRFKCFKFRSMVANAEDILNRNAEMRKAYEGKYKLDSDPRITPFGRFIRRTSIDELPQFFNVLKGEMTLVGPRPKVPKEAEHYGPYGEATWSVKPGLGGLWQVLGRSDLTYEERIATEVMYINMRSTRVDLILLWRTLFVVLGCKGAY